MSRLHALLLLAVLVVFSIGCDTQPNDALPNTELSSATAPTPNSLQAPTTPISQPTPPQFSRAELEIREKQTKKLTKTWVENAQLLAEQTNDPRADASMTDLKNICYGAPGEEEFMDDHGQPARRITVVYIDPHKEKPVEGTEPTCVRFVILKDKDRQNFPLWNFTISRNKPLVYSKFGSVMVFNYELALKVSSTYLRGLLIMHNMVHREQWLSKTKASPTQLEGEAFSRELELMDQLKLPGYHTFLSEQAKKEHGTDLDPNTIRRELDQMFGRNLTTQDRNLLAYRLFLRILVEKQMLSKTTSI